MPDTHGKMLEALAAAEKMEVDGKAYYLKLSTASVNPRGRELFRVLASEEDVHRADFNRIFEAVRDGKSIPPSGTTAADCTRLRHLFSQAAPDLEPDIRATAGELEAIDAAVSLEQGGIDYYRRLAAGETDPAIRKFYAALIRQEESHRAALLDYREYVTDPEGWLVRKALPSAGSCFAPHSTGNASELEW